MESPLSQLIDRVKDDHAYHPPKTETTISRHERVREVTQQAALDLLALCPVPSRGLSMALTKLDEARMWANMAIACERADGEG